MERQLGIISSIAEVTPITTIRLAKPMSPEFNDLCTLDLRPVDFTTNIIIYTHTERNTHIYTNVLHEDERMHMNI